ncbi:hypothetical protein PW5551_03520 [Petrotoga sp. 9PW.55.5.1]|uniref:hypothetical protein n=1 Tax=Petrotoga sp. 9PW.55.5.1 TaxID=1308979 RepID=UPI000DC571AC|nr:hypothetical protein [Petrotoga sp. 9PW.55.5.1]RAO99555.1 hypothetical protein PW5551_03520 [Petrotoga sp. 9PW.55.5.1]
MKKKIFLIILFIFIVLTTFSQSTKAPDMRRIFLIYVEGDAELNQLLENSLENNLLRQSKYRVVTKEDILLENLLKSLSQEDYISDNIQADFLVYVQIIEAFPYRKKTDDLMWWEYRIYAKCQVIKISSGESMFSRTFSSVGTSYVTQTQSDFEALYTARRLAVNNLASSISNQLNYLFRIRANIVSIEDKFVRIDSGRNIGIKEGMMFEFVKSQEIDGIYYDLNEGKLIVEQAMDNSSILRILEPPKSFDYKTKDVYVIENPDLSPIRTLLNLYYVGQDFERNGFGFELVIDTYSNFYLGMALEFLFGNDLTGTSFNFKIGYLNNLTESESESESTLSIGSIVGMESFAYSNDATATYFKLAPFIKYTYYFNDTFGLSFETNYNFLWPLEIKGTSEIENYFGLNAGITFRF